MALPLDGPTQTGRGVKGQYVYWIVMPMPKPLTVAQQGVKTPRDFDRQSFREVCVEAHTFCQVDLLETACFLEPHANGDPHLNLLVRAAEQYKWKPVAQRLLNHHHVHVSFGSHITTWQGGVVYGCVASEHKNEEDLDKAPEQWKKDGSQPTPLKEFLPLRFRQPGFVRHTRLTPLAFFDLCAKHKVATEEALWAKATDLSDQGDRALLSFLLENDAGTYFAKVVKAQQAKETLRRSHLTREELLEEYVKKNTCSCAPNGHCHALMKRILQKSGIDGPWQKEVFGALRSGRAKMRNLCLLGPPDCAKSFLLRGFEDVFRTYKRPDGGSYQLEDLLGAELVFLNDFEYDAGAKDWMPWSYFKNFLEGASVTVGCPKNKGGNQVFKGTAPVLLTAPEEVKLKRYGREDVSETKQMQKRIKYFRLTWQIPEGEREEVLRVCAHCTARLYLEGKPLLDSPAGSAGAQPQTRLPANADEPAPKRPRTASECVRELQELKALLDSGLLSKQEFADLKGRLLSGN